MFDEKMACAAVELLLSGVAMELEDSLYPLLREVNIGVSPYESFTDANWALLIGAKPRGPGMERSDLLDINGQIFAEQVCEKFNECWWIERELATRWTQNQFRNGSWP